MTKTKTITTTAIATVAAIAFSACGSTETETTEAPAETVETTETVEVTTEVVETEAPETTVEEVEEEAASSDEILAAINAAGGPNDFESIMSDFDYDQVIEVAAEKFVLETGADMGFACGYGVDMLLAALIVEYDVMPDDFFYGYTEDTLNAAFEIAC